MKQTKYIIIDAFWADDLYYSYLRIEIKIHKTSHIWEIFLNIETKLKNITQTLTFKNS